MQVSNCEIRCQDDACALFGSNKFVTVNNCAFSTRWSVFRFGSGEAQNITVSNCLIYETYGCPIKISSGRGARIENLSFSNIVMKNVTGPIGIGFAYGPQGESNRQSAGGQPPFVRNISFTASAYHCSRILRCKQVQLEGVRIFNRVNLNNDGFHFNSCE